MSELEIPTENNLVEEPKSADELLQELNEWYAGDLHTHSTFTNRGEGVVDAAGRHEDVHSMNRVLDYATKLGRRFVVFSEHSSDPGDPQVLEANHPICEQVIQQAQVIKSFDGSTESAKPYSSVEANLLIDENGEAVVDIPQEVLGELDFRIASIHAINNANKRDPEVLGRLLLAAVRNPQIDEIGHPYRHVEFHPNDWDYFKKYFRDKAVYAKTPEEAEHATFIAQQLGNIDSKKDYDTLKKIIGKIPVEGTETNLAEIEKLKGHFDKLSAEYWTMWNEVLAEMEATGTIFELNLNSFRPNKPYYQHLLALAAMYPNLNYSLVYDFHNTVQHRKGIKESELTSINESLFVNSKGKRKATGRELAIRKLLDTVALLKANGITPDQVVNSSEENFERYLASR